MDHQGRVTIVMTHLGNVVNNHDQAPNNPGSDQMTPTRNDLASRIYTSQVSAPNAVNKSQLSPRGINQSQSKFREQQQVHNLV